MLVAGPALAARSVFSIFEPPGEHASSRGGRSRDRKQVKEPRHTVERGRALVRARDRATVVAYLLSVSVAGTPRVCVPRARTVPVCA